MLRHLPLRRLCAGSPPPLRRPPRGEAPNPFAEILGEDLAPARATSMPPPRILAHAAALERRLSLPPEPKAGAMTGRVLGEGRFVLEDLLGTGSNGEVYRATHTALRRPVAVKLMHRDLQQSADYCRRFHSEALAISRLDHRNLMRVHDYGQDRDGLLYIVMELLLGKNLYELLLAEGPMPARRVAELVSQACAGLSAAHDAGVVHRDIKPENLVVTRHRDDDGRERELVKVCDFGIAAWTPPSEQAARASFAEASRAVVGTPAYMAPEQIRNEPIDARTDVYALGCVMFELATGRPPFEHEDVMRVLMMHVEDAAPPLRALAPDADPDLEKLVQVCLEKDPARRLADARAVRIALRALSPDLIGPISLEMRAVRPEVEGGVHRAPAPTEPIPEKLRSLAEVLRVAALAGDTARASAALAEVKTQAADPMTRPHERAFLERAVQVLRAPEVVQALTARALDPAARPEPLRELLVASGTDAARALVEARQHASPSLEVRARLVSVVRSMGDVALPAIAAALETVQSLASRADEALATDLLDAIPDVRSEPTGDVVARFVRVDHPDVGALALRALTSVWGPRAHPMLLGALDAEPAALKLASLRGLAALELVDAWTVERLVRIVSTGGPEDVRAAAACALALAPPEARPKVVELLQQRLASASGRMSALFGSKEAAEVLVAMARSLHALDPGAARPLLERVAAARPEVRGGLSDILPL